MLLKLSTDNDIKDHHLTFETRGRKKLMSKQSANLCDGIALHELFLDKTGAAAYLLTPTDKKDANFFTSITAEPGKGPAYDLSSSYGNIYLRKSSKDK